MGELFKEVIHWVDDTVSFVLSRKHNRDVDPAQEVGPIVDKIVQDCIGNRTEIGQETLDLITDTTISWCYQQLRSHIPPNSGGKIDLDTGAIPTKKCLAEFEIINDETPSVSLVTNKIGKKWPCDQKGRPVIPDKDTVVIDSKKQNRIVILE